MPRREGDVLRLGTAIEVSNERSRPDALAEPGKDGGLISAIAPPRQRHLPPCGEADAFPRFHGARQYRQDSAMNSTALWRGRGEFSQGYGKLSLSRCDFVTA
jgi:hypothetical protein